MPTEKRKWTCFGWKTEWCYTFDQIIVDYIFVGFTAYKRARGKEKGTWYTWKRPVDPSQLIFPGLPGLFSSAKASISEYSEEEKKAISDATVKTLAVKETKAQTLCFSYKLDKFEFQTC